MNVDNLSGASSVPYGDWMPIDCNAESPHQIRQNSDGSISETMTFFDGKEEFTSFYAEYGKDKDGNPISVAEVNDTESKERWQIHTDASGLVHVKKNGQDLDLKNLVQDNLVSNDFLTLQIGDDKTTLEIEGTVKEGKFYSAHQPASLDEKQDPNKLGMSIYSPVSEAEIASGSYRQDVTAFGEMNLPRCMSAHMEQRPLPDTPPLDGPAVPDDSSETDPSLLVSRPLEDQVFFSL